MRPIFTWIANDGRDPHLLASMMPLVALAIGVSFGCANAQGGGAASTEETSAELLPAPEGEELMKATQLVSELFKSDVEKAKTPPQKQELAKTLIQTALDTKDDPLGRFALLQKGADLAASGGSVSIAAMAIDELAKTHKVDALELKLHVAETASKVARLPKQHEAYFGELLPLFDASVSADRYAVSRKLTELLARTAKAARNQKLTRGAAGRTADVDELAAEYEKLAEPLARHKAGEATADDKLAIGTFMCFLKGDWKAGLPLLAEGGGDGPLHRLAADELSAPEQPADQLKLADSWWTLAEESKGLRARQIRQHAAVWYVKALPGLAGLSAAKAKQHIELAAATQEYPDLVPEPTDPPAPPPPAPVKIDLLALSKELPLTQQVVGGEWSNSKDGVVSGDSAYVRMALPYRIKGPYELEVEFTMLGGKEESVCLILPVGDRQTVLTIDGWVGRGYFTYLCNVQGREAPANPDAVRGKHLKKGRLHNAHVDVAWDDAADAAEITFTLDGEKVFSWQGELSDLSLQAGWEMPKQRVIGLASYVTPTEFSKVKLVEK